MKRFVLLFLFFCLQIFADMTKINIVTEYFPPYQWKTNGLITGPSTEVIHAISKEVGMSYDIQIYPWARAYKMALNEENILIYSISRIEKREKLFKWIGAIMSQSSFIWKLKSRKDIVLNTLEDAKKYKTVSVNQDARAQYLFSQGFKKNRHLHLVSRNEYAIKLLYSGRMDLIVDTNGVKTQVENLGLDFSKLEKTIRIEDLSGEIYAAFSLMTPNDVVNKFRKALKTLKEKGEFKKILKKYQ